MQSSDEPQSVLPDPAAPEATEFDPLAGVDSADLGTAAKIAKATGVKVKTTIESLAEHLHSPAILQKIQDMTLPKDFDETMGNPMFAEAVDMIMEIVEKYKTGDFNPVEIERDILRLGSLMVYFGSQINYTDSLAADATSRAKQALERAFLETRVHAERSGWHVPNVDTVKALASTATEDMRAYDSEARTVAMTFRGFYFASKEFLKVMDAVAGRAQFERRQASQA